MKKLLFATWLLNEVDKQTADLAHTIAQKDKRFKGLFKDKTRVVFPLNPKHLQLEKILAYYGFQQIDWKNNTALKPLKQFDNKPLIKDGNPVFKKVTIGKAIQSLPPSLQKEWNKWYSMDKDTQNDYSIVISRHPLDILRMSDHYNITSCHSPGGLYYAACLDEMKHGGLVAYLVKTKSLEHLTPQDIEGNREIFSDHKRRIQGIKPVSRIRLRRFDSKNDKFSLAIPEDRMYGDKMNGFEDAVMDWARKIQEPIIKKNRLRVQDFVLRGGSYRDSSDGALFNKFFGDNLDVSDTTHGIEGSEDQGDNIDAQRRAEIEQMNNEWNGRFEHCWVHYEESDGEHEPPIKFSWDGGITVSFPSDQFFEDVEIDEKDLNGSYNPKRDEPSLINALRNANIYVDRSNGEPIRVNEYKNEMNFLIEYHDEDSGNYGSPDQFNEYCQTLESNFENEYKDIYKTIKRWCIDRDFMDKSSAEKFSENLPSDHFQHLSHGYNPDEEVFTISGGADLGPTDYKFPNNNTGKFEGELNQLFNNVVHHAIDDVIVSYKNKGQLWLKGFQSWRQAKLPEMHNTDHPSLKSLHVDVYHPRYYNPGIYQLVATIMISDVDSEETLHEAMEVAHHLDRDWDRIIQQANYFLFWMIDQENKQPHVPGRKWKPGMPFQNLVMQYNPPENQYSFVKPQDYIHYPDPNIPEPNAPLQPPKNELYQKFKTLSRKLFGE